MTVKASLFSVSGAKKWEGGAYKGGALIQKNTVICLDKSCTAQTHTNLSNTQIGVSINHE